jgi:hypothetical protein
MDPPKGYPMAISKPKISKNKQATTSPNIHSALGMKAIPRTTDSAILSWIYPHYLPI